jgi:hypothetical protein
VALAFTKALNTLNKMKLIVRQKIINKKAINFLRDYRRAFSVTNKPTEQKIFCPEERILCTTINTESSRGNAAFYTRSLLLR